MRTPIRKAGKYTHLTLDHHLTEAMFKELSAKLQRLIRSRPRLSEEVKRLSELGDFSENAAYQMAKGSLRSLNQKIISLENQVKHAVIIKPGKTSDTIQLGCTVTIASAGQQQTYQILGSVESNPARGVISHHSPVGLALMGRKVGDKINLRLKNNSVEYTIIKID